MKQVTALMRVLRVIYLALIAAVGVYGVMAVVITGRPPPGGPDSAPPPDVSGWLVWFAGAALLLAALAPLLRRRLLTPAPSRFQLTDEGEVPDDAVLAATGRLLTAHLTSWAVCEAIALLGFVLALVADRAIYFLPFAAASLILFACFTPTLSGVQRQARTLLALDSTGP